MITDNDGKEYAENTFLDIETGKVDEEDQPITEKVMLIKPRDIQFCEVHKFDKEHSCTSCPYMFTGFQAHRHIQTNEGIFMRLPSHKLGKRLA